MRACVNMDQGGAIVDLRPYAAKLEWPVGIGTKHVQDASYPFLIQEKYRAGYFTHYAGEGTVRSAKLNTTVRKWICACAGPRLIFSGRKNPNPDTGSGRHRVHET